MVFVIISISVFITTFVLIGAVSVENGGRYIFNKYQLLSFLSLAIIGLGTFYAVPNDCVGILYHENTKEYIETLSPGFYKKSIYDDIYSVKTTYQDLSVIDIKCWTKDHYSITANVNIRYRITPTGTYQLFEKIKYTDDLDIGLKENHLDPIVRGLFTLTISHYDITEILGEGQEDIINKLSTDIPSEFSDYGIELERVMISSIEVDGQFRTHILSSIPAKTVPKTTTFSIKKKSDDDESERKKKQDEERHKNQRLVNDIMNHTIIHQSSNYNF